MHQKPLIDRLREFLLWLQSHALPGFKEASEDIYDPEGSYLTSSELLLEYATELKKSVEYDCEDSFTRFKALYLVLFDYVNKQMAINQYHKELNQLINKGVLPEVAEEAALTACWAIPLMKHYLPAKVILKHQDGRKVFLVASERHIPQGSLYVLTTELEDLKRKGLDPWDYVSNRKA